MYVLGVDISKESLDVALTEENRHYQTERFSNTDKGHQTLRRWLRRHTHEQVHLCLEATGRYGEPLAHFFSAKGYVVSMINPAQIHAYGKSKLRRNKTEQLDARLIADFCFTQQPPLWQPPTRLQRESKELSRHIGTLKEDRQRKRNQLQSGITSPHLKRSIEKTIRFLDKEIALLENELEEMLRADEKASADLDLLLSVPGIGPIMASRFLSEGGMSLALPRRPIWPPTQVWCLRNTLPAPLGGKSRPCRRWATGISAPSSSCPHSLPIASTH